MRALLRRTAGGVDARIAAVLVVTITAAGSFGTAEAGGVSQYAVPRPVASSTQSQLMDRAYVVAQSGGIASLNLYSDGSVRRHAPILPTGAGTFGPVLSPDRRYMYVAPGTGLGTEHSQGQEPQIVTVRIRPDGRLRKVGEPIRLDPSLTPVTGAISSDGRHLYFGVGNLQAGVVNGAVMHFRIGRNGVPVQRGGPVSMGLPIDGAAQPVISPDGKWLYVASLIASSIVRFAIRPDGSLSKQPVDRVFAGGSFPINPTISPNGRFLYVANEQNNTISGFEIQPDGALRQVPGSPFLSGSVPHNFAFSEDGKFLYSANTAGNTTQAGLLTREGSISAFHVKENGALVPLPGSPYPTHAGAMMVNTSTDGRWLYLTSAPFSGPDTDVVFTSYKIRKNGTLNVSHMQSIKTGLQSADGPETVVIPAGSRQ